MTYYRIAIQTSQSPSWHWLTTPLTSLQAVFHFLQRYHPSSQANWRIFSGPSAEALEEMLAAEQEGNILFSATPAQLLGRPQPRAEEVREQTEAALAQARQRAQAESGPINTQIMPKTSGALLAVGGTSSLDLRRLELELGAGGDHDTPYVFAFPRTLPEICAWLQLQAERINERWD